RRNRGVWRGPVAYGAAELFARVLCGRRALHHRGIAHACDLAAAETKTGSSVKLPVPALRSDRHVAARTRRAQRLGQPGEFAQQRTGLARIDDLLDPEFLSRAERRAQLVEAILDLPQFG